MCELNDELQIQTAEEINYWNQRLAYWVSGAKTYSEAYARAMQCYDKTGSEFWLTIARNNAAQIAMALDSIDRVENNLNEYEAEWSFS